jgi:hypothetical protein
MKKIILALFLLAGITCFSDVFEFVNSDDGTSYIQINENLESFTFSPDWHSLGNAGRVGYVVYTDGMSKEEMRNYISQNADNPQFGKHVDGGKISLGSVSAGDRIGFYEVRPNGGVYVSTSFKDWNGDTWLAFDKNGGHGKDEWMRLGDADYQISQPGPIGPAAPSGAPLPGAVAALAVGLCGFMAAKLGKKRDI